MGNTKKLNKFIKILFSMHFASGLFGSIFWFLVIKSVDNFSAGIIIGLFSVFIAYFWSKHNYKEEEDLTKYKKEFLK